MFKDKIVALTLLKFEQEQNIDKSSRWFKINHSFLDSPFFIEAPPSTLRLYLMLIRHCCVHKTNKIVLNLRTFMHLFGISRYECVKKHVIRLEQYQLVTAVFSSDRQTDKQTDKGNIRNVSFFGEGLLKNLNKGFN